MSIMSLATLAALPTSVWMRIYAVTTGTDLLASCRPRRPPETGAQRWWHAAATVIGAWLQSEVVTRGRVRETPASSGAITNSALLLLLVLPGFFELLTQLEVLLGEECLAGCLAAQVEHQTVEHSVIDIRGVEGELLVPVGLGVQAVCHALGLGHCLTSSTTLPPQGDAVGRHGREGCQLLSSKTMRAARIWRGRVARRPGVLPPRCLARWPQGSPDQRRPGDMGHDARRPTGRCGEPVDLQLGGRLWWCRRRTGRASGRRRRWRATLSHSRDVLDHEVMRGRWFS